MLYDKDQWLKPFKAAIDTRKKQILTTFEAYTGNTLEESAKARGRRLTDVMNNHLFYGLHKTADGSWVFREWAPNANRIYLICEGNNWKRTSAYELKPIGGGTWELKLPAMFLSHGELYKLFIEWPGGGGERLPAYCTRAVQDPETKMFCAQVWDPQPYQWRNSRPAKSANPLIYECHIGMSSEEEKVASFEDFRRDVLPHIAALGYNTIQIMALQEHPYYGSFGYQVSNFYALSSRFGTPEEFKALVDDAHGRGIAVIMDIVHSHSVDNEAEGLSMFDGREDIYFYKGPQGRHPAWGSRCFDYGKDETKYFLLSNCKFWMEEYNLDGFRFDGVTSMLYWDHGLGKDFNGYASYFDKGVDDNAVTYLAMANILIHEIDPGAISIAEDVSGMAGLAAPIKDGGVGFDYRMAMGIADHWIKWIKEKSDEQWSPGEMWYELTNKRADEKTISYAECHDQALVGDKTIIFRLIDKEMYFSMNKGSQSLIVDRGVALHKMIRLVTLATCGGGYLTFMGNEFGHPEWIDFPREGNNWSYKHARRLWSLSRPDYLRYKYLQDFDGAMISLIKADGILGQAPELLRADEQKNVLIFRRGDYIFAFNFNPSGSWTDYGFPAPRGTWEVVLSSDDVAFDGFGRIKPGEKHTSVKGAQPDAHKGAEYTLKLYLPSRCCFVLKEVNR